MVHLKYPLSLTAEEKFLKKKYEILRQKQKALANFYASKETPPPPPAAIPLVRTETTVDKTKAVELAKILLRAGALKPFEVETKERRGFKRPRAFERKLNSYGRATNSMAGNQPLTASHYIEDDGSSPSLSRSEQPPMKKLCETFVSGKTLNEEMQEDKIRSGAQKVQVSDEVTPERLPRKSTICVTGIGITPEFLQKIFEPIGNIIHISMENDKNCGFVTFEKSEQAERAFKEINDTSPNDIHLNILLASKYPLMQPLEEDSFASLPSIASKFVQKENHESARELVMYDI